MKTTAITSWLLSKGFLEEVITNDGKKHKWPTESGLEIGIKKEKATSKDGFPYHVVLYGKDAQQFIADNIGQIISFYNELNKSKDKSAKTDVSE